MGHAAIHLEPTRSLMDHRGHPNNGSWWNHRLWPLPDLLSRVRGSSAMRCKQVWKDSKRRFHRQFYADGVHFEFPRVIHSICLHAMWKSRSAAAARRVPAHEII